MSLLPLEKLLKTTQQESISPNSLFTEIDRNKFNLKVQLILQFRSMSQNLVQSCKDMMYNETLFNICADRIGSVEPIKSIVKYTLGIGYYIITKPLCNLAIESIAEVSCAKYNKEFLNLTSETYVLLDEKAYSDFEQFQQQSRYIKPTELLLELWPTVAQFRTDLMDYLLASIGWLPFFLVLIDICLLILYFISLFKSIVYHYSYLNKINFDNYYVNRYFRKIDRERQNLNKIHLLPLRGKNRMNLISPFQFSTNLFEKKLQVKRNKILFVSFGLVVIFIVINVALTDFATMLASTLAQSNFVEVFVHRFLSRAEGTGFFAKKIDELLEKLHFNYTRTFRNEWNICAKLPYELNWLDYTNLFYQILFIMIIHFFSIYLIRTRHMICDFFYYRHSKRRTLFLYNQLLVSRKKFLEKQKIKTENFIKGWWKIVLN